MIFSFLTSKKCRLEVKEFITATSDSIAPKMKHRFISNRGTKHVRTRWIIILTLSLKGWPKPVPLLFHNLSKPWDDFTCQGRASEWEMVKKLSCAAMKKHL